MSQSTSSAPDASDADTGTDPGLSGSDDSGASDETGAVLVTICQAPDGGYLVYAGDEPDGDDDASGGDDSGAGGDAGAGDGGGDDTGMAAGAGMGAAGGMGAGGGASAAGQPAASIGAALKAALDILNEDASSAGAEGSSADQFAAGFGDDKAPTPASGGMKYPATRR